MKTKIFLLGDSISLHYNPYLIPATSDRYEWETKKGRAEAMKDLDVPVDANGGTSAQVLAFLRDEEARGALHYDVLLFNCGLHDIAVDAGKTTSRVSPGDYHKNLNDILDLVTSHGIRPIWVTTTPVIDEIHNTRSKMHRYNENVLLYNAIAKEVMKSRKISSIDLYSFTVVLGGGEKYADHVHFAEAVRQKQATFIEQELDALLLYCDS